MVEVSALQRLWLMDWFGHIIEYDTEREELVRSPFVAGEYPDTFILASWPVKVPMRVMFRREATSIQGLPEAKFVSGGEHVVALQSQDSGNYFSINPRTRDVHWNSGTLFDWERFIPVTQEVLDGISILQDHSFAELKIAGEVIPPLGWPAVSENIGNFAWLGDASFSISWNLDKLAQIGRMKSGQSMDVMLASSYGDVNKVTIIRTQKELKSFIRSDVKY